MKKIIPLLLIGLALSCQKKKEPDPPPPAGTSSTSTTTTGGVQPGADCVLPPPPDGFDYVDSTFNAFHNVNAFFYNPVVGDEVIVVVEGNILGGNEMLNINLKTRKTTHLAYLDKFLPSINNQGWILFSTVDDNVFKIKANGDSLRQLTTSNGAHDPKWDRQGKTFFYLQDQQASVSARVIRLDKNGNVVNEADVSLPYSAPFQKSNKVIIQRNNGPVVTLYELNLDSTSEKSLISGTFNTSTGETSFQNLMLDENDAFLFWSNNSGIFKHTLATGKTDTLFKTCATAIYSRPLRSGRTNEITFSKHTLRPSSPYFLIHEYKAIEYNVALKLTREVSIF